jgi:type IV secretion system protein TrbB
MEAYTEGHRRIYDKLNSDLGCITGFLQDIHVEEIMLNPDGSLWIDHVDTGVVRIGEMDKLDAFSIIHTIAGMCNLVTSHQNPHVEADFPIYRNMNGERFTAQIPPIVSSPSFCIRKRSRQRFTLSDYLSSGRITEAQFNMLCGILKEHKNILVCGGSGTGKTTFANALIAEVVKDDKNHRFLLLEDVAELQCDAENHVSMLTSSEVDITRLLRDALRMRPDRIFIGEVRGKEALDMLKAWHTSCPGGICTLHANGAKESIRRILDLILETGLIVPPIELVRNTIDVVVSVIRRGSERGFIQEIVSLGDYQNGEFLCETLGLMSTRD